MIHDNLWAGVELKLQHAEFHLRRMAQALEPPQRTQTNVALEAAGAILDTGWQLSFYAHFDAFLSATRSVADIINCCFGEDNVRPMREWFAGLPEEEKGRRKEFSNQFKTHRRTFAELRLSTARNISVHRTGYPDVTVTINGVFGVTYLGGPTKLVPISESRQIDDASLPLTSGHLPIRPHWADFKIEGEPLFDACSQYFEGAKALFSEARSISDRVHGTNSLTPPSVTNMPGSPSAPTTLRA